MKGCHSSHLNSICIVSGSACNFKEMSPKQKFEQWWEMFWLLKFWDMILLYNPQLVSLTAGEIHFGIPGNLRRQLWG